MDISKQPINTSTNISQKPDAVSSQTTIITDINALKLEVGKVYSARVIQASENNPPSTETPPKPQTDKLHSDKTQADKTQAEQPVPDAKQKTLAKNEWLILLKGKVILISSEKPLETGQKLLLKLEPSAPGEKPTLLAQALSNKITSSAQKTLNPELSQALNINKPNDTNNARAIPASQVHTIETKNIQQLLQALNLTLDKQLPLKQGFDQLSTILQTAASQTPTLQTPANVLGDKANNNKVNIDKINTQTLQAVKSILLETLPKLKDFAQIRTEPGAPSNLNSSVTSSPSSNIFVKNSLLNSGILLEKTLLSEPNKLAAFKEQLVSLEGLITKSTSQIAPSTTPQHTHSAIAKIQQTIESLLKLAANQTSKTILPTTPASATATATATATVQFNDLKANLMTASALLSKQLSAELSASELKNIFLGAINDEAFVSPFAFPIIPSANLNASKALFDKQEFSTGQILKILAGMIHKLQFNQLNSLLQSNSNIDSPLQQTWFFELPILNPNQTVQTFNFRIDKEPQHTSEEQSDSQEKEFKWKLLLSFDLDSLGPIYIQITLSKTSISSVLWADKDSTLQLLEQESQHFKLQLEKIGLKVDELHCKKGQPNQTQTKLDRHLVDTKA